MYVCTSMYIVRCAVQMTVHLYLVLHELVLSMQHSGAEPAA